MPYEDFQNDLFGAHNGQSKPKKKGFSGQRLLPNIKIPLEYTVIAAVAVMVLVIISYAIGVEIGKKSVIPGGKTFIAENDFLDEGGIIEEFDTDLNLDEIDVSEDKNENQDLLTKIVDIQDEESVPAEIEKSKDSVFESLYTIQLASFKDKDSALDELNKLKDKGIRAEYAQRGDWYQVYATGYHNIEEAKKAQTVLMLDYSDCFIRKIN